MKKRCRLCLETNAEDYYSIHEECNGGPTYAEFVQQLAAVEIEFDDSLPQDVCEECHSELQRILEFSAGIRRADEELRNELNNDKHRKQVDAAQENQYRAQEDEVCVMEEVLELDADNQESFVLEEIQDEMHLDEDILELHNEVITDEVITDEVATDVDKKPCLQKEDLLAKLAHVAATQENVNVIDQNATNTTKDYAKDENDEDYLIEFDPNETLSPNLKPPKWKCGECKVVLRGDVSYEGHMNMHKQLKPHKCSNCNWEFRCRTALKKHQESRHTSPAILELNVDTEKSQPRYICEKCSLPFKTEVQCYLHKIIFHKMYSKITTCPFCSSILVKSLKDHLETFHTDNDITEDILTNNDNVVNTATSSTFSTVWQCNQCSNTYPSLELLSNHQHLYHKSDQQQSEDIKVDYLDDIPTSTKVDYIEDEPITTSSTKDAFDNTSVQCEICKRKLLRRNLNKHMELHNRQDKDEDRPKKFLCAHCRAATLSAFDKMLSNPSNFQQNPLESQVNKEDTLYFRQNACVNEIGHLNFKQIPSTQEIKKICEFRDAHKIPVLENKHRTILAKALISYILKNNPNQMLKSADFTHLAQSIVNIFPSELKETYFVPSQKGHVSRGKLFDAYHNTRTRLRALGVVSGRPKSKFSNHTSESGSDSEEMPTNSCHSQQKSHDTPELNLEQALNFFQTNDCVIKEENLSIEEEFPKIKEEFPCIEEDNFSIEEEYPSFSQDINFLLRGDNYENLPSTEVIKQIFEFQEVLNLPALQNKHRISISKALIAFLLNDYPDRRLVREDFLQLAQSIVEIFPAEVIETYYIPFQNGKLARGKLFIAYSNRRAQFRNEGVIPKRALSASESNNADNSRSMLSATESSRDLDDTLSNSGDFQQNSFETSESLLKVTTAPFSQTNAGFGESPGPLKFGQPYFYKQLPTTQEIRKIWDFQVALKVPKIENKHRNNMAKSLIGFILKNKPNRRLGRDDFLGLAQSIVDIFPSEITETYYVPFEKGHLARGKLYMAYNNIKARLAAAGIIRRRSKSKVENPTAENSVSSLTASESGSDQEEILTSTSNSLQNCFEISESLLEEQTTYFIQAQSAVSETSNDQFSEVFNFSLPSNNFSQLPTTEEIRQIYVIQDVLKVQTLENKHRTSIAKAVILYVLRNEPNKRLVREDFLQLVESIVEIFPTEVKETYYIPFQKGQLARGKLYDAYNNAKSRLGAAGLITRRVKNKVENIAPKTVNISNTSINLGDPIESDFEIFKSDCPEWSSVLTSWKRTHAFRQNELQTKTLSIAEYFDKYKVLYNEKNYELFDIDFKILYPTSKSIYEWKLYYEKILQKSKLMRSAQEILTWIQNADSEDLKLALSLTLVCYLLPNSRKRKKSEIQESFICYCKDIDDNEIEHRVKRIKVETEPRVILFGDSNDATTFAYVDICGIRLKFENPMKAVEVCFQSFMVLNIKYPKYCSHVWLFMQKMIFDVNTPEDVVFPAINTLINDLQPDIQK